MDRKNNGSHRGWAIIALLLMALEASYVLAQPDQTVKSSSKIEDVWVKLGENVTLSCGLVTDASSKQLPAKLNYEWQIQGLMDYEKHDHPRYVYSDRMINLTIVNVQAADQRSYTCDTVSGFQTKATTFRLHVINTRAQHKCVQERGMKMCFADANKALFPLTTITKPLGSRVEMDCHVFGLSQVTYTWLHDGSLAGWADEMGSGRQAQLNIRELAKEHEGRYTCEVSSPLLTDKLTYSYKIVAEDPKSKYPEIMTNMENRTIQGVDNSVLITAQIRCNCLEAPTIMWMKRIDSAAQRDHYYRMISHDARTFVFPQGQIIKHGKQEEQYFAIYQDAEKLIFAEPVTVEKWSSRPGDAGVRIYTAKLRLQAPLDLLLHAGQYLLMTYNDKMPDGVLKADYRVFLIDIEQGQWNSSTRSVIFYFLLPFALVCTCVMLTVYCVLCRRRRKGSQFMMSRHRVTDEDHLHYSPSEKWLYNSNATGRLQQQQQNAMLMMGHSTSTKGSVSPPNGRGGADSSGGSKSSNNTGTTASTLTKTPSPFPPSMYSNGNNSNMIRLPPPPSYPPPQQQQQQPLHLQQHLHPGAAAFMGMQQQDLSIYQQPGSAASASEIYDQNYYTSVGLEQHNPINL